MTKKIISVVLAVIMLFVCALPVFAMTEESAREEVAEKIWLADETTQYTITDEGTFHKVIAVDHGVTYEFHVKNTDGAIKLISYATTENNVFALVGMINGILLQFASMFVVF